MRGYGYMRYGCLKCGYMRYGYMRYSITITTATSTTSGTATWCQTSEKPHAWGVQSLFWLRPTRLTCVGRAWGVCLFGRGAKIANLCIKSDEFCLMFDDVGREEWIKSKSKWIK